MRGRHQGDEPDDDNEEQRPGGVAREKEIDRARERDSGTPRPDDRVERERLDSRDVGPDEQRRPGDARRQRPGGRE